MTTDQAPEGRYNGKESLTECICGNLFPSKKGKECCSAKCRMEKHREKLRAELVCQAIGALNEQLRALRLRPFGGGE